MCVTLWVDIESVKGFCACIYWKKWRFGRVLPIPNSQKTTEYRATQLVESIKFKLSHAITWGQLILYPSQRWKWQAKVRNWSRQTWILSLKLHDWRKLDQHRPGGPCTMYFSWAKDFKILPQRDLWGRGWHHWRCQSRVFLWRQRRWWWGGPRKVRSKPHRTCRIRQWTQPRRYQQEQFVLEWSYWILAEVTRVHDHLQEPGPSKWSLRGRLLQMIICKMMDPLDDHLQEVGSSGWSFARARSLQMITY